MHSLEIYFGKSLIKGKMKHLDVCNERRILMPTINQIIRKGRTDKKRKTKAPALNVGYDSRKKKQTDNTAPQKRGVCTRVGTMTLPVR